MLQGSQKSPPFDDALLITLFMSHRVAACSNPTEFDRLVSFVDRIHSYDPSGVVSVKMTCCKELELVEIKYAGATDPAS